jgi:hypothetical protein
MCTIRPLMLRISNTFHSPVIGLLHSHQHDELLTQRLFQYDLGHIVHAYLYYRMGLPVLRSHYFRPAFSRPALTTRNGEQLIPIPAGRGQS